MNFFRFCLAIVLSVFLTGQALATAPEARILERSASSDSAWQAYLGKLAEMTLKIGDQEVKGYNPETRLVFTAAVMQRVCYNQAEAWKQACAKPGERFTLFAARNGWKEAFVPQDELRQQAHERGVFFPFAVPAAVAAASAPAATPAPAAVATAPTPAAPTTTAPAVPAPGVTALMERLMPRFAALEDQRAQDRRVIAELREQLRTASSSKLKELTERLEALEAKRGQDDEELVVFGRRLSEVPTKPQVAQAAEVAASAAITPLNAEVERLARQDRWLGNGLVTAIVIAGIAFFGTAVAIGAFRLLSRRLAKHEKATATEFKRVGREMRAVAADADAAVGASQRANQLGLTNNQRIASVQLTQLDHGRQLQAAGHVLGVNLKWTIAAAEAEVIEQTISSLKVGERSRALQVTLPNTVATLEFEKVEGRIIVHGMVPPKGQPVVPFREEDVLGAIRKAYFQGRLSGIKVPALFQVVSAPERVKVAA
jgi:hypothetical protein